VYELESKIRGHVRISLKHVPFKHLRELGDGFYNIRVPFRYKGLVDIGNHMSFCRLSSGAYLAIDAIDPRAKKGLKAEIDRLTRGGHLIDAVIATHPFHTLGFKPFQACYPSNHIQWYGTPRHLRRIRDIPWCGDVHSKSTRSLFEPDVSIRIPCGTEFVNPQPPDRNHFANAFVYHKASRTVHNDDCICYYSNPSMIMSAAGARHDMLSFHQSLDTVGLILHPDSPMLFQDWLTKLLEEWDFDNLATAHNAVCVGNANNRVRGLLLDRTQKLAELSEQFTKVLKEETAATAAGDSARVGAASPKGVTARYVNMSTSASQQFTRTPIPRVHLKRNVSHPRPP